MRKFITAAAAAIALAWSGAASAAIVIDVDVTGASGIDNFVPFSFQTSFDLANFSYHPLFASGSQIRTDATANLVSATPPPLYDEIAALSGNPDAAWNGALPLRVALLVQDGASTTAALQFNRFEVTATPQDNGTSVHTIFSYGFATLGYVVPPDLYDLDPNGFVRLFAAADPTGLEFNAFVDRVVVTGANGNIIDEQFIGYRGKAHINLALTSVADAIPEPSSWALMILGFGSAGAALRRRSKAPLAA